MSRLLLLSESWSPGQSHDLRSLVQVWPDLCCISVSPISCHVSTLCNKDIKCPKKYLGKKAISSYYEREKKKSFCVLCVLRCIRWVLPEQREPLLHSPYKKVSSVGRGYVPADGHCGWRPPVLQPRWCSGRDAVLTTEGFNRLVKILPPLWWPRESNCNSQTEKTYSPLWQNALNLVVLQTRSSDSSALRCSLCCLRSGGVTWRGVLRSGNWFSPSSCPPSYTQTLSASGQSCVIIVWLLCNFACESVFAMWFHPGFRDFRVFLVWVLKKMWICRWKSEFKQKWHLKLARLVKAIIISPHSLSIYYILNSSQESSQVNLI